MTYNAISTIVFKDAVASVLPTNHVFIVDVSGSMYSSLPKIREHLKSNLASLVKEKDTVSLLYFSSKGQYGSVFVGTPIRTLSDLTDIHNQIDRFIKPTGCTGFVEPLQLAIDITKQLPTSNINSLVFMTDGYDNEWSDQKIIEVSDDVSYAYDIKTIIEYGWYCNHDLLVKMSEAMGASHIFAESYNEYEPIFEKTITNVGSKRKEVDVSSFTNYDTVLYRDNGKIISTGIKEGKVFVPEHIDQIWVTGRNSIESLEHLGDDDLLVLLHYALSINDSKSAWKILSQLGDVRLIQQFANTFSKQDHINFTELVALCLNDVNERFVAGREVGAVPDENTPTVIDILTLLMENDVEVITNPLLFNYSRTGAKRVQADDKSEDELFEQMANAKSKEERKELAGKLAEHINWKPKFIADDELGVTSIGDLVLNSTRPNVSIRACLTGVVPVPKAYQKKYDLPETIETIKYNNYTIIRDGIINMRNIPVVDLSSELTAKLLEMNALVTREVNYDDFDGVVNYFNINLDKVPLMNLSMVNDINGQEYAEQILDLERLKARQKVLKFYREEIVGKVNNVGLKSLYGDEAADYLSSIGIRDYGFTPYTDSVESTDVYMAKEFLSKIKGASSLPAVNAVLKKVKENKKLNIADQMMYETISQFTEFRESDIVKNSKSGAKMLEQYIKDETQETIDSVRKLNKSLSRVLYAIVVGRAWFSDIDFENPVTEVDYFGQKVQISFELIDKEIKI